MTRIVHRRRHGGAPALVVAVLAALWLLPGCADDGAGAPLGLEGTWAGTRTEGAQAIPFLAEPMDHAPTGGMAVTFVEVGTDTFTGTIDIDADICWWAGSGQPSALVGAVLNNITVTGNRIAFEYDSVVAAGGVARFVAPYPPSPVWTGSYNGADCARPDDNGWLGNFSLRKE